MGLQTNLYDSEIYFALSYNGFSTFILEPKGWDKITNHIPRDPKWMGFWSDFIEDKYGMLFTYASDGDLTGGAQMLYDIYNGIGSEAIVYFSMGIMNFNTPQQINEWKINLNVYVEDFGGVSTSIEKMPFQGKLRARMSKSVTINDYTGADGNLLTPIPNSTLRLHSKSILETTGGESQSKQISDEYVDGGANLFLVLITPDQSNLAPNELSNVFTQQMGFVNTGTNSGDALTSDTFTNQISNYVPTTSGTVSISYSGSFTFWAWCRNASMGTVGIIDGSLSFTVTPRLVVQRYIGNTLTIVNTYLGTPSVMDVTSPGFTFPAVPPIGSFPQVTGTGPSPTENRNQSNTLNFSWNENSFQNILLQQGDNVYIHLFLTHQSFVGGSLTSPFSGLLMFVDNYTNNIEYTQLTVTPGSTAPAYRAFDLLTQMVESITGQKNAVISNYFSEGGEGYKFLFSNGYGIRNFGGSSYKMIKDLSSFLTSLQNIECLGVGIKKISGIEYLVIEKMSHFFQNGVILRNIDTFLWKNKHSSKFCYNKVEYGYSKFEGLNLIQQDEYNVSCSALLQFLQTQDNVLNIQTDLIYSGYLLEEQRRNQFIANPGQSLTNDSDWFGIATFEPNIFKSIIVQFDNVDLRVGFFQTSMTLILGDTFTVDSGSNLGTIFTIQSEVPGYPILGLDIYQITPAPINEAPFTTNLTIIPSSPDQVFAERNQPFSICSGIIDPSTIYNARRSPKHILYNWRPLLGVGLFFVDIMSPDFSVSQIINTPVKMNSLLTTKYLPTEQFKGNIGDLTITEINREFITNYLHLGSNLFQPTGAECKIKIGWNEMNILRQALSGETGDTTLDYGGVVLNDDKGQNWFCHIIDIQYDIVKQVATLDVQKVKKVI